MRSQSLSGCPGVTASAVLYFVTMSVPYASRPGARRRIRADMDTLLWIDVETTGLDPDSDALLEIGMLYTDGGLHPIDAPLDLVLRWDGTPDDFIKGMHGPNGLLDACRHGLEPKEAYRLAGEYAHRREALVAGSTVRFDRGMLDAHDPRILAGLGHRSLDVSALDEAARLWNPACRDARPERTTDHRCLHCLDDSIRLARHYRTLMEDACTASRND